MLAFINRLITLPVVFESPHSSPKLSIVGCYHSTLATRGHYFVLTKTPCTNVTNCPYAATFIAGSMGLGTILDDPKATLLC
jgi:hypothetical protein